MASTLFGVAAASVPLAGMACVTATVIHCYSLTKANGRMAHGLVFPPISALGTAQPEKFFYQTGFTITGIFVICALLIVRLVLAPHLVPSAAAVAEHAAAAIEDSSVAPLPCPYAAVGWGMLMCCGIIMQGVFVLELKLSLQSFVHWAGALLFIMSAMQHAPVSNALYALAQQGDVPFFRLLPVRAAFETRKACLAMPVFLFVPALLWQVVEASGMFPAVTSPVPQPSATPTATGATGLVDQQAGEGGRAAAVGGMENSMGLMQWLMIGNFVVYFGTYSVDLFCAVAWPATLRHMKTS